MPQGTLRLRFLERVKLCIYYVCRSLRTRFGRQSSLLRNSRKRRYRYQRFRFSLCHGCGLFLQLIVAERLQGLDVIGPATAYAHIDDKVHGAVELHGDIRTRQA